MVTLYGKSLDEEQPASLASVSEIYQEAGIVLPGQIVRRLEEVQEFHQRVGSNRREFLASEIQQLNADIANRERQIRSYTEQRASSLLILQTHGALDEHAKLQQRHTEVVSQLNAVNERLDNLRRFAQEKSSLKIELERLMVDARSDNDERRSDRQKAISIFNVNSEALYEISGSLIVDIDKTGFKFQVEIKRSGSTGIEKMKVFCYDLMLAQLWAEKEVSPRFLIHDSTIFDGVDERQRALALQLAAYTSEQADFQYICCFNSDEIPYRDFTQDFEFNQYVRLTLTDATEEGGLLGIRF